MTPLLPSLLAALSLSCFAVPVARADDAEALRQLREENAALRAKLGAAKSRATASPVLIGRKTPPDLVGLDIFGSVACDLDTPPPSGTPEQLKSLKDWRMNLLGEWNAKARASIARGVSAADVARWNISLHWTQVVVGEHLISIVCHVSEETDGSSPSSTIHTFNFIDGAARPVSTAGLLAGDDVLPTLRALLEKHKGDVTLNVSGNDNLFRLASLAKVSGGTLTLAASPTNGGGFTLGVTDAGGFVVAGTTPVDDKAIANTKGPGGNVVLEVTPEISKDGIASFNSRPAKTTAGAATKGESIISAGILTLGTSSAEAGSNGIHKVKPQASSGPMNGTIILSSASLAPAAVSSRDSSAISAQSISELGTGNLRKVVMGRDTVYFCFDPGVVAPVSRGVVVISMPAAELKPLLSTEGRTLVEKN
jgi:hypothetical protein